MNRILPFIQIQESEFEQKGPKCLKPPSNCQMNPDLDSDLDSDSESELDLEATADQDHKRAFHVLLLVWIAVGVVLSNAYRGVISAEYSAPFPFETHWKECRDFVPYSRAHAHELRIYFPLYGENLNAGNLKSVFEWKIPVFAFWGPMGAELNRDYDLCKKTCNPVEFQQLYEKASATCRLAPSCAFLYQNRNWGTILRRVSYYNFRGEEIQKKMNHPGAVFMTPVRSFEFFWTLFRMEMRRNGTLKFAHNRNVIDNSFLKTRKTYIWPGLDPHRPFLMGARAERIHSSGMYKLWRDWEDIRLEPTSDAQVPGLMRQEKKKSGLSFDQLEDQTTKFKPLSIREANIYYCLIIFLVAVAPTIFICLAENSRFDWICTGCECKCAIDFSPWRRQRN